MPEPTREAQLSTAFVTLADTLVADFDLVDLLQHLVDTCARLLDASSAGLLLKNEEGGLDVIASTTDDANFIEIVQVGAAVGPCLDCVETGQPITVPDIEASGERWPDFRRAAATRGIRSAHATPMRLRDQVIGTMNLFNTSTGALNPEDVAVAQALTDVATIGILSERATRESRLVSEQLQHALNSRIVIEQAKGVIAESLDLSMDIAFILLRSYARRHNLGLGVVARQLINRDLAPGRLRGPSTRTTGADPSANTRDSKQEAVSES